MQETRATLTSNSSHSWLLTGGCFNTRLRDRRGVSLQGLQWNGHHKAVSLPGWKTTLVIQHLCSPCHMGYNTSLPSRTFYNIQLPWEAPQASMDPDLIFPETVTLSIVSYLPSFFKKFKNSNKYPFPFRLNPESGARKPQPSTKYGPLPVAVNKVLLKHNRAIHLAILYGYFCSTKAGLRSCNRDLSKSEIF